MGTEEITTPVGEVEESMLATEAGTEAEGTPPVTSQEQGDADKDWKAEFEKLSSQFEKVNTKFERDISQLKSSLQRNAAEDKKKWEYEKAEYERRLQDTQMAGMSESDRKAYQAQVEQNRLRQMEEENSRLRNQMTEQQQRQGYAAWFLQNGVRVEDLVMTGSVQELVDSGWSSLKKQKDDLQMQLSKVQGSTTKPSQSPPNVIQPQGGVPVTGPTWTELIKKYGTQEQVYKLVEQGTLPPSIIPT